jgi:hypothetical protein
MPLPVPREKKERRKAIMAVLAESGNRGGANAINSKKIVVLQLAWGWGAGGIILWYRKAK